MGFHTATRHSRNGLLALVLAVFSVLLMGADSQFAWTRHIRSALLSALYPVQQAVHAPLHLAQTIGEQLQDHFRVYGQNQRLQERIRTLRVENQELEALKQENQRLRQLLNEAKRLERSVSAAQIVAESPDPFHHTLTISRGKLHGVYRGQPVISDEGVVGQVSALSPLSAQVILLTDPNSGIPVLVRNSRVRGILAGTGSKDSLQLRYVPTSAGIEAGDELVTSGLGAVFPKGLLTARVTEVVRDPHSPFASVTAHPAVPVSRLEDVLLLELKGGTGEPERAARQGDTP
jgi:rod shape-determining protein MreC